MNFLDQTKLPFEETYVLATDYKQVATVIKDMKMGYTGALLMKEADLVKRPKRKLDLFIAGRKLLETALLTDYENTEFHFLRLTVQEHAPRVVRYHSDIERDKSFIIANFKNLSPVVQKAILDYCRESKVLHVGDLQVQ